MWSSWEIYHVSSSDITFCFKRSCLFWNRTWPWKSSQVCFIFWHDLSCSCWRTKWVKAKTGDSFMMSFSSRTSQAENKWFFHDVFLESHESGWKQVSTTSQLFLHFWRCMQHYSRLACEQGEEKEREEGKKGTRRNAQKFWFPYAGNWCHIQINLLGGKHNNSSQFWINYTATKLG